MTASRSRSTVARGHAGDGGAVVSTSLIGFDRGPRRRPGAGDRGRARPREPAARRAARTRRRDLRAAVRRRAGGRPPHVRVQRPRATWPTSPAAGSTPRRSPSSSRRASTATSGLWQPSPADGADRGERHPVAVRSLRLPREVAGAAADGRLDGEPVRDGHRPPRQARRGLPRRHLLRERRSRTRACTKAATIAGLPHRGTSGSSPRTTSCGWTPRRLRAHGRARPRRRAASVPGGAERGHDEHRRDRPDRPTSPTSPRPRTCGCTSTAPTAGSSSSPSADASGSGDRAQPTRITLDPHKGLFLPYGTGGLVVRDGAAMRDAHYEGAAYLQDLPPTGELPELQRALGRALPRLRGLRVWMPLALHGVVGVPRGARREARSRRLPRRRVPRRRPDRAVLGTAAHRDPVPAARAPTTTPNASSWPASTPRSGCSCRAR